MSDSTGGPGCYRHDLGSWVIAGDGARSALADPVFSSQVMGTGFHLPRGARAECAELLETLGRWFVMLDGDEHKAARRKVGAMFSAAGIRRLREELSGIVADAVDGFARSGGGDAIAGPAAEISARAIGHIVGLPDVPTERLHGWARAIADFIAASYRVDRARRAQEAVREMGAAMAEVDGAGAIWALAGDSDRDRLATCSMVLFGGLETSASLIGMTLWYAVENKLTGPLADEEADSVVEQVLAFRPPLGHVARTATGTVTVDGTHIPATAPVVVSLTGRDPFTPTDAPTRAPTHVPGHPRTDHLAFGVGPHFCIGAALARLEATLTLREFASRCPNAKSLSFQWNSNRTYRGLEHLEIAV
ncbi:cytochrome P450 [Actinokineospora sp. 24-640]